MMGQEDIQNQQKSAKQYILLLNSTLTGKYTH